MKLFAAVLLGPLLFAADLCQPTPEVRQELKRLDIKDLAGPKRQERVRQIVEEIIAKHPQDFFALQRYESTTHRGTAAERNVVAAHLKKLMDDHQDDAGFAVLYAKSLVDTDTPQAIKLLQNASAHPASYRGLATLYDFGKFADKAQARTALQAYFAACPSSVDEQALSSLQRLATPEMAQQHAARLRALLTKETDAERLRAWDTVWNLEFKARPVPEHAALRKQIAADAARLEDTGLPTTEQGLGVLLSGYKQANNSEAMQRIEQRLIAEHPRGWPARSVVRERWQKEHPWPSPTDSEEKKQEYHRAALAHANAQLERLPGDFEALLIRFSAVKELKGTTPEQVGAAGDEMWRRYEKGRIGRPCRPLSGRLPKPL